MQSNHYDIAIIGAGVVGCAMARRFTLDGARVLVLEKAPDVLDGASKGNSAILHTGFDAPPQSIEHHCIQAGYQEYLAIAESLSLPILKSSAMVIAWTEEQLQQLPKLIEKAHQNGVNDVAMLTREAILRREPNLSSKLLGGFEIPGEYLIDPWSTAHAYILQAIANGATLERGVELRGGEYSDNGWTLTADKNGARATYHAKTVINCAGLYGDVVDQVLIKEQNFTIAPRKGQFVVFDKAASELVSAIILPVPTATTKGVVICRTIFGNVLVGPTAEEQESRTDSATERETLQDLRRKGIEMLPGLNTCEVTTAYAGLRPATEFKDYQIKQHSGKSYITVGGIRSTGLSAALGIAQYVAKIVKASGNDFRPITHPKLPTPDRLSNYHQRDWQCSGNDGIVCHCELVSRREINNVLDGPMPPGTLQGLKRRTRSTMGRCQGFYCMAELAELTKGRLPQPITKESNDD